MRKQAFDPYRNRGRLKLTRIRREREGRAMRYMGDYYWTRTTFDLEVLHSKKYNRLTALRREPKTYLNMRETKTLVEQMNQIEAVLEARRMQSGVDVE